MHTITALADNATTMVAGVLTLGFGTPPAAAASCRAGVRKVGGVQTRTFGGTAKGSATIGTTKLAFPVGDYRGPFSATITC